MPEIHHLEPKHLSGKDGIGKGTKLRHGADLNLYRTEYDRIFGKKEADVADDSVTDSRLCTDGSRNGCTDKGWPGR